MVRFIVLQVLALPGATVGLCAACHRFTQMTLPGIKPFQYLRAYQVLRVNVRSLFRRDAVAAIRAGSVWGCANLSEINLSARHGQSVAGESAVQNSGLRFLFALC